MTNVMVGSTTRVVEEDVLWKLELLCGTQVTCAHVRREQPLEPTSSLSFVTPPTPIDSSN